MQENSLTATSAEFKLDDFEKFDFCLIRILKKSVGKLYD